MKRHLSPRTDKPAPPGARPLTALAALLLWSAGAPIAARADFEPWQDLTGVFESDAAWGDFDFDGDLDLVICGLSDAGRVTRTYENQAGTLALHQDLAGIQGAGSGCLAWGDYDGDGDLDLAMAGMSDTGRVARVYDNDGDGDLTWNAAQVLTGVSEASVAWGDHHRDPSIPWGPSRDGDLDLLVMGHDGAQPVTILYKNHPSGTLAPDPTVALTGLYSGSADWADWNGDSAPDLLLTGYDGTQKRTIFYRNSFGVLAADGNHGLPDVWLSDAAWGDYDGDGDLDLALTGEGGVRVARVYSNDGAGNLTQAASLMTIYRSSCAWGDHDNDGDLDLALCGYDGGGLHTRIFTNTGSGFDWEPFDLESVREGSLSWADADQDGDLDFLVTGADWSTKLARLYRNTAATANTAPSAPTTFGSNHVQGLRLTWDGASDAETPAAGLYYGLRVGTAPGAGDVVSGTYGTPLMGNVGQATSVVLDVFLGRRYYWSVQAIDAGFLASSWSAEQVSEPDTVLVEIEPGDDAYIDSSSPGTPFGSQDPTRLIVGHWAGGCSTRTYLKFYLASNVPEGAQILRADLHVYRYGGAGGPHRVAVWKEEIDNWDENVITWNNAPRIFAGQPTASLRVDQTVGWCVWDVTSDIAGELVDGNLTEVLCNSVPPEGTGGLYSEFWSDEHGSGQEPYLSVTYTLATSAVFPDESAGAARVREARVVLEPNAPNPFRWTTAIAYDVSEAGPLRLTVWDASGRAVRHLVEAHEPPGRHRVLWDGRDDAGRPVASGVYFYRLEGPGFAEARRTVLAR